MTTNITLVSYTHDTYKDIWPLMLNGIINAKIPIPKILLTSKLPAKCSTVHEVYDDILVYDDTAPYPARLLDTLTHIKSEYILFIPDIEIIVNFDWKLCEELLSMIQANSIDRFIFGMIPEQQSTLTVGNLRLTNADRTGSSPNWYTPYDVGPSIWKVSSFLDILRPVKDVSYRDIELSIIQKIASQYDIWAVTVSNTYTAIYQIDRPFSPYFTFLHILSHGKWYDFPYYMDLEGYARELFAYFNIKHESRGLFDANHMSFTNRSV